MLVACKASVARPATTGSPRCLVRLFGKAAKPLMLGLARRRHGHCDGVLSAGDQDPTVLGQHEHVAPRRYRLRRACAPHQRKARSLARHADDRRRLWQLLLLLQLPGGFMERIPCAAEATGFVVRLPPVKVVEARRAQVHWWSGPQGNGLFLCAALISRYALGQPVDVSSACAFNEHNVRVLTGERWRLGTGVSMHRCYRPLAG